MSVFRLSSLCAAGVLCIWVSSSAAWDDPGITVTGTGEALASPDRLEVDVGASGSAELTGDALVKYRDRLRRVTDAFKKLDVKQLRLEQRELSIGNVADEQHARPQVTISKSLRVVVNGIQQLPEEDLLSIVGKVIDAAKDTGVATEEAQDGAFVVRFALEDATAVHENACRKAFERAKEEGSRLAKLAGGKLGRVISVQEVSASGDDTAQTMMVAMEAIYGSDTDTPEQGRIVSDSLREIPVRVSLRVRFELLEDREGAIQAALEK
ncbi:MAG TPA: SIMPL domain-containing protein [Pirellulales bacterium]|jgi:uncharacterized protein YggE|nr:SIMPL domain-containing protein [Pirellulales bacterium]